MGDAESQLSGADIGAAAAWGITTGSDAIVVGVVDRGIDDTHPDLAANVWTAPTAFTVQIGGVSITCPAGSHGFNAISNSCDPMDDNAHGTHLAGTIGAVGNNGIGVTGVSWNAKLMGLKFLDANSNGFTAYAINAIEFAIQAKALTGANVRVLSTSWGGNPFSPSLLSEINSANANNMLCVVGSSNVTVYTTASTPAGTYAVTFKGTGTTPAGAVSLNGSATAITSVQVHVTSKLKNDIHRHGDRRYWRGKSLDRPDARDQVTHRHSGAASVVLEKTLSKGNHARPWPRRGPHRIAWAQNL